MVKQIFGRTHKGEKMLLGQEFSTDFAKYKTCSLDALLRFDLKCQKILSKKYDLSKSRIPL